MRHLVRGLRPRPAILGGCGRQVFFLIIVPFLFHPEMCTGAHAADCVVRTTRGWAWEPTQAVFSQQVSLPSSTSFGATNVQYCDASHSYRIASHKSSCQCWIYLDAMSFATFAASAAVAPAIAPRAAASCRISRAPAMRRASAALGAGAKPGLALRRQGDPRSSKLSISKRTAFHQSVRAKADEVSSRRPLSSVACDCLSSSCRSNPIQFTAGFRSHCSFYSFSSPASTSPHAFLIRFSLSLSQGAEEDKSRA